METLEILEWMGIVLGTFTVTIGLTLIVVFTLQDAKDSRGFRKYLDDKMCECNCKCCKK